MIVADSKETPHEIAHYATKLEVQNSEVVFS